MITAIFAKSDGEEKYSYSIVAVVGIQDEEELEEVKQQFQKKLFYLPDTGPNDEEVPHSWYGGTFDFICTVKGDLLRTERDTNNYKRWNSIGDNRFFGIYFPHEVLA